VSTVFVPVGSPVRRFVGGLAAVAVFFGLVWWSGLVAARVEVTVAEQRFDPVANIGSAAVFMRNEGELRARVENLRFAGAYVSVVGRPSPAGPFTLGPGDFVRVVVEYTVDCARYARDAMTPRGVTSPSLRVRVRVVGAVGAGRSVEREMVVSGACGEPEEPG
jgi:hypothetical protein